MGSYEKNIRFTKMHGAGNDYIYIDALSEVPENLPLLSRQISNRHYGVGSDGLVAIMHSETCDFRMRMFNSDGSEAQMCGNASRCIGKYVYERGLTSKTEISLETLSGVKTLRLTVDGGKVVNVKVDMGVPDLAPDNVPVRKADKSPMIAEEVRVGCHIYKVTAVNVGNPHGVVFSNEIDDDMVRHDGPLLEAADIWPEKANIEFAVVESRDRIRMRVWERGSGETLACGTGACAAVVAAVANGLTGRRVTVELPGGGLDVEWNEADGHVWLSGGAEFIADGVFYPDVALARDEV